MSIEFRRPADSSLPVDCPTPRLQKASGEAGYEAVSADDAQAFEQAMARDEAGISLYTDVATGAGAQAVPGTGTDPLPTPQDILSVWPGRQDELDLQQPQSHDADWHKTGLGEGDGIEAGFPSPDGQPIERSPGLIHKAHGAASDKSAGQPNAQSQGSWISKKLEPVPRHHGRQRDGRERDAPAAGRS